MPGQDRQETAAGPVPCSEAHSRLNAARGVDVLTVSRRLGHGKASVTLDTYGNLIEGADAAAAKAIEGVLK